MVTDSESAKKYKKKVSASQKKGLERKVKLDTFEADNDWVMTFYAKHTFEVDFVTSNNDWEVRQIIGQVYSDQPTKDLSDRQLTSTDVAIYGKRVLTMARHVGKGWFAIMLGKHITPFTEIPDYIIDAILFAKETYSSEIIADIINYRIEKNVEADDSLDFASCRAELLKYRNGDIKLEDLEFDFDLIIPNDQTMKLINKLK